MPYLQSMPEHEIPPRATRFADTVEEDEQKADQQHSVSVDVIIHQQGTIDTSSWLTEGSSTVVSHRFEDSRNGWVCKGRNPHRVCKDRNLQRVCKDRNLHSVCKDRNPHRVYKDRNLHQVCKDRNLHQVCKDRNQHRVCKRGNPYSVLVLQENIFQYAISAIDARAWNPSKVNILYRYF